MNDDKLVHYGVGHLKGGNSGRYPWGSGKYKNKDGSLTPAGIKKAKKLKASYKQLTGKKLKGGLPKEDPSKKSIKQLSNTELNDRVNRLRKEKEAKDLQKDLSSNHSKFMRSVARDVLAPAAINSGRRLLEKVIYNKGADALGLNKKSEIDLLNERTNKLKALNNNMRAERDFSRNIQMDDEYAKKAREYFKKL